MGAPSAIDRETDGAGARRSCDPPEQGGSPLERVFRLAAGRPFRLPRGAMEQSYAQRIPVRIHVADGVWQLEPGRHAWLCSPTSADAGAPFPALDGTS